MLNTTIFYELPIVTTKSSNLNQRQVASGWPNLIEDEEDKEEEEVDGLDY